VSPPRINPLPVAEWGDDARRALAAFSQDAARLFLSGDADAPRPPNVLGTLMRHPSLAGRWLAYNAELLERPVLDPRLRELAVLRVAWRTRSTYEWLQHIRVAQSLGVTAAEIDAVAGLSENPSWTPLEAAVLTATDELLGGFAVSDATWERLADHLDERRLVELVFVVGSYTCLAMAFNAFGLALDPDLEPFTTFPVPT
jgi:4-carboxymuconolactone decarboxylase